MTALRPSAPQQVEIAIGYLQQIGVNTVIPLGMGLNRAFQDELSRHGVRIGTLHHKEVVIVGVAVVTLEIKVPLIAYAVDFGRPEMGHGIAGSTPNCASASL